MTINEQEYKRLELQVEDMREPEPGCQRAARGGKENAVS
jgi:hypothetical protein